MISTPLLPQLLILVLLGVHVSPKGAGPIYHRTYILLPLPRLPCPFSTSAPPLRSAELRSPQRETALSL